jgi:putative glutamine amidotransferase
MVTHPPIVGIPCDHRMIGPHPFHAVGQKYIVAMRDGAGALPLLIPVLPEPLKIDDILSVVDGLLFTGSPSNVAPKLYGGHEPRQETQLDEQRDQLTLPLMRAAAQAGTPMLCLCRGFQELNVAFGGTLHQHLHEVPGRADHREDKSATLDVQYDPAHEVSVMPGGMLAKLALPLNFKVNSLHSQGVDKIGAPLRAEARAPDGTIEAVSKPDARGFLLGVQWHPEWRFAENPVSQAILAAFGASLRAHAKPRVKEPS